MAPRPEDTEVKTRVSPEVHALLVKAMAKSQRTMAAELRVALDNHLAPLRAEDTDQERTAA